MKEAVILGGGALGAAIARAAAGRPVVVASPTPRAHAGLWRHYDAERGGRPPVRGADVWVAIRPRGPLLARGDAWLPELVNRLWHEGAASVTVAVSAGDPHPDARLTGLGGRDGGVTTVLRVAPLFGLDDRCVGPLVRDLRAGRVAHHPRGMAPAWALAADDAGRAALRLAGAGGSHVLRGTERLDGAAIAGALAHRFGGRCTERWMGGLDAEDRRSLAAQAELRDDWDDARLGPRLPFRVWVDRLPGPRPRR